jgi:serine/threonine protein kinase
LNQASEKSIFLSALEYEDLSDRAKYLSESCGGDIRLRAAVEELLQAHQAESALDRAPAAVTPLRAQLEAAEEIGTAVFAPSADSAASAGPPLGAMIGRYKLLEQIGEGGFGLVYVAEQQQPIRRRVALKLIKPGMDSREVIGRFEAERQALAMMDHANIARVFDAGTTGPASGRSGQPYFVMELVRGIPLTRFCDENRLTTRQRLELFVDMCNAVQHAHQKGIIHRDLKPSNVLVTLHDGTPVVKVIDFGVAKAMSEPLTEKTLYTRFAQMIGTPLYMSPEQAEMSGLDVDTRSDIYSLGVMLYELLTGTTPFDRSRFKTLGFDELRRIIREEEPPRPSMRLTTLGQTLSTVSTNRRIEPRALSTLLRGDLDWIVMKALEKDRRRRYATAAEFAADVRRYLAGEPIAARPPTLGYQFSRFARRHKVTLWTTSIVFLALVLGTGISVWQAIRATAAQTEADSLRKRAVEFADRLKAANVLLDNARANADEEDYRGAQSEYSRAAELQPEHYLVWSGRGSMYARLGLWRLAAQDYAKAIRLGAPANNPGWWGVPQLFLYEGETAAYREACRTLRQQLNRTNDPMFVALAIRSCLVSRDSTSRDDAKAMAARLDRLMSEMAASGPWFGFVGIRGGGPGGGGPAFRPPPNDLNKTAERPGQAQPPKSGEGRFDPRMSVLQYIAALAHYRAGNSAKTAELLKQILDGDQRWPAAQIVYPVLAMAHYDLGQKSEAADALGKAKAAIDSWTAKLSDGSVKSLPLLWFDFIECLLLTREANQLIMGQPPPDDPRLTEFERKARAAIEP